jgi:AraC family transcriptional regulator, arabinose operon regulatory protein
LKWQGEYKFGPTWIAFRGISAENHLHAHAAIQLVVGSNITVTDDTTFEEQGDGWLIPSGVKHRIVTTSPVVILLIDPDSTFASALKSHQTINSKVVSLSEKLIGTLLAETSLTSIINQLEVHHKVNDDDIDPRLTSAVTYLNEIESRPTVEDISIKISLSVSRLRALSVRYFGVPFSKIIMWKQVNLAFRSLSQGGSIADAAYTAGFSDQAHFTRILRDTIGITPGQTQDIDKQ